MRWIALGLVLLAPSAWAAEFLFPEAIVTPDGQEYEALQMVAGADGDYRIGARAIGVSPLVRALQANWFSPTSFAGLAVTGMPEIGSLASGRGAPGLKSKTQFMTVYNPTTGVAAMAPFMSSGSFIPTQISSPNGPVVALPNAISVDANGRSYSLFEVRPASGPREVIFLIYEPGVINYKLTFPLQENEKVLTVTPNPDGGIIFMTNTPSYSRSVLHSIDSSGRWMRRQTDTYATHAVYLGEGKIALVDNSGRSFRFFTGPMNGYLTSFDGGYEADEIANITCGAASADGTVWWGGSITRDLVEKNPILIGVRFSPSFQVLRIQELSSSPGDQTMRAITATPNGYGVWAADGQCGLFDQSSGATITRFPAVPFERLKFRSVAASSGIMNQVTPGPFHTPYSNFGVVAYDTVNQRSYIVKAVLTGLVKSVSTPMTSMLGGSTPTIYVQLYQSTNTDQTFSVTSSHSDLTVPASITVPAGEHIAAFTVQTKPVYHENYVTVFVGPNGRSLQIKLVPPTPKSISPASQTVTGGATTSARLTMNARAPGTLRVALKSDGQEVMVDSYFEITEGLVSKTFSIRTTPVSASATRTITATYSRVSRQATVTVEP